MAPDSESAPRPKPGDRIPLIRDAALAAAKRLTDAAADEAAAFAAIGELIFWIVAADDGLLDEPDYERYRNGHKDRKRLMQGFRYPRNVLAHEAEAWVHPLADVYSDVYSDTYGTWVWSDLHKPSNEDYRAKYDAYCDRLRGRPIIDTALEALEVLKAYWPRDS